MHTDAQGFQKDVAACQLLTTAFVYMSVRGSQPHFEMSLSRKMRPLMRQDNH